jgi:hypothetical protein
VSTGTDGEAGELVSTGTDGEVADGDPAVDELARTSAEALRLEALTGWPQFTALPPPWASQLPLLLLVTLHPVVTRAKQVHSARNNTRFRNAACDTPLTGPLLKLCWDS